jgi:type II secretory pathway pseudopilin PulG
MNNKPLSQHKATGFTIVELLVVISIIALLVGILVPAVQKARDSAKTTQSKSNIHQVMIALANYAADQDDRNFSTAPDDLSRSANNDDDDIGDAISNYGGPNPLGIELGTHQYGNGVGAYFMTGADGVAPYCFGEGRTQSSSGKEGYGTNRYPNAGQVAVYMNNMPLHSAYFAPKDTIPLSALEGCDSNATQYCPSSAAQARWGLPESYWNSNMLLAPSSYCISPAMMYDPAVYQWDMLQGKLPKDPMELPRGFKPPSTSQSKYPSQKTWLMEHNWLQNLDNNECGINWTNTWFEEGDGCWDGCEPEHYNAGRLSEPVTVMGDGSTTIFKIAEAARDSEIVQEGDIYNNQGLGLWDHPLVGNSAGVGYYAGNATDWVQFVGHAFTMDGIRGRDKLAK